MTASKSSKPKAAKGKKADPAALAALIHMMMAAQQGQGQPPGGPMAGPAGPPPWRANRPPILSPSGTPPLLG